MQENVDPSKIKDDNYANRLFNLYWEAPSDPTIYRRKLLNVQKTREKQQAARRSFNRGHSHSRSRSASPSSQDGLPAIRNAFTNSNNQGENTQSATSHIDEPSNQAAGRLVHQGSYQGSFNTSSNEFGYNQDIRLLGYNSGAQPGFSGPQSFSEAGNSVGLQGSFNEVDFALALHRPGVLPMGDSVTTATTSTTSLSSGNNSRSTYNQSNNQTSQSGSYGSHQVLHYGNQQRRFAAGSVPRTSRSFEEGDLAPADSAAIPTEIDSHHQQVLYSSSHESGMDIGPPIELKAHIDISVDSPMKFKGENIHKPPAVATSIKTAGQPPPETMQPTTEDDSAPVTNPNSVTNHMQPNHNFGVYDNPVYQQQLVAMQQQFQQHELLLQQQQAALALQQEQLRAYYSNISNAAGINAQAQQFGIPGTPTTPAASIYAQQFGIPGAPATPAASINVQQFGIAGTSTVAINAQQFGLSSNTQGPVQAGGFDPQQFGLAGTAAPVHGGGYYVVPAADGTHMIVPSNQVVATPRSGQVQGISPLHGMVPGQLPGLPAGPAQIQGITATGFPSVGITPGTAVAGMPGIQGIHNGGMIPPAGSVPGVGPAGMATILTINNNTSPAPCGLYPNSNNHQHLYRQP